ncbi:MAG: hypothetical protein HY904_14405 [Deltaproteobacteria bacterium]|nr:hypothetical protein [Deltaproteobacteria bacterium]
MTLLRLPTGALAAPPAPTGVFLPGTQPGEGGIELGKVAQCRRCHNQTRNGDADPFFSWEATMMSQAARDPVFRSALAVANQDIPGVGEWCIRCHAPRGWLEGRSKAPDGALLTPEDMHGVSCEVCHHLVDPRSAEAAQHAKTVPPGLGSGMMVVDGENTVRGPYGDGRGAMPHNVMKGEFQASGELCGTCHNVSNPLAGADVRTLPPHAYGAIERTYSEWALSAFAQKGAEGTCQACHMPAVPGGGQASRFGSLQRPHFVSHAIVGGSSWAPRAVAAIFPAREVDPSALEWGAEQARQLLRRAARLELTVRGAGQVNVRVVNLTGHKLPTGYPEGRRAWVNARFLDVAGAVLAEVGRYGNTEARLKGKPVSVPTLLDPERTRVYQALPGLSPKQAARYRKKPGKSFHFVLNDVMVSDNRIPPEGFSNQAFATHLAAPVGATYADGQSWDDVPLTVPPGTARVEVRLYYQSVSWEYLRFLVEENRSDAWSDRLYQAWSETGQCAPEVMAEAALDLAAAPGPDAGAAPPAP